jgi:hypothetical protein
MGRFDISLWASFLASWPIATRCQTAVRSFLSLLRWLIDRYLYSEWRGGVSQSFLDVDRSISCVVTGPGELHLQPRERAGHQEQKWSSQFDFRFARLAIRVPFLWVQAIKEAPVIANRFSPGCDVVVDDRSAKHIISLAQE